MFEVNDGERSWTHSERGWWKMKGRMLTVCDRDGDDRGRW